MSFQTRIIGMMAILLVVCLMVGAVLLSLHARKIAAAEVGTAFRGSVLSVSDTLRSNVLHTITLRNVVHSFQGQRHVRAALINENGEVIVQSQTALPSDLAPDWFVRLVAPPRLTTTIPIALKGYPCLIRLTSDPRNEVAEIWASAQDAFTVMLLFCGATMVLVFVVTGAASRFFARFRAGLMAVAAGDYSAHVDGGGPAELRELAQGFNHMAARLMDLQRRNSQLDVQLQTMQEDERKGIARDLHDEVGPQLFALQVDAKAISKLGTPEAERLGFAVRDTVARIQQQVSSILRQLRPLTQLEFGLEQAIGALVTFWSRRHPGIRFESKIDLPVTLERTLEEVAYRVVQESISNAVRHGQPSYIAIAVTCQDRSLIVMVSDDGGGAKAGSTEHGLGHSGIAGMEERVRGVNGSFRIEGANGDGVLVRAILPLSKERELA